MAIVDYLPRYAKQVSTKSPAATKVAMDRLAYNPKLRGQFSDSYFSDPLQPTTLAELGTKVRAAASESMKAALPAEKVPWRDMYDILRNDVATDQDLADIEGVHVRDATAAVNAFTESISSSPWVAWKHIQTISRQEASCSARVSAKNFHAFFKPRMSRGLPFDPGGSPSSSPKPLPHVHFPHRHRVNISKKDFTIKELEEALSTMPNHTAPGPDGIPIEALRQPCVSLDLLMIANALIDAPVLPPELIEGYLTPIFKRKGDAALASSYRPIVLLSVSLKLMHKMMLLRIRKAVDPYLLQFQHAYREGLSTIMSILPLHELAERARKSKDRPLFVVFTDFTSAFDSIERPVLFHLLREYGVPERFVSFLENSHAQQELRVRVEGAVYNHSISPDIGVMQGDTLAPYMFLLVMDQILRKVPYHKGAIVDDVEGLLRLPALAYADDVALLANSLKNAQELVTSFEAAALEYGLHLNVNVGKTELMVVAHEALKATMFPLPQLTCTKGYIKTTSSYRYLGFHMTAEGSSKKAAHGWQHDFKLRKRTAWFIARKFQRVWGSDASDDSKKALFHALVYPVLLYAALSYPATLSTQRTLHVETTKLLRYALRCPTDWRDPSLHTSSVTLYDRFPILPFVVTHHSLTQLGHWVRAAHHSLRNDLGCAPVVAVLQSISSNAKTRGLNWPPSRTFSVTAGVAVEDLIDSSKIKSRKDWRIFCSERARALTVRFVDAVIVPRSLGHTGPSRWYRQVDAWVTRKERAVKI
jgi:hypothetical protein